MSIIEQKKDQGNRHRFYPTRRRIGFSPAAELLDKTVVESPVEGGESGIFGPHPLESLAHRQQDVRYPTRCDAFTAGSNPSLSIACGKHLEEGDGIVKSPEERIDPEFLAKVDPNLPMGIL